MFPLPCVRSSLSIPAPLLVRHENRNCPMARRTAPGGRSCLICDHTAVPSPESTQRSPPVSSVVDVRGISAPRFSSLTVPLASKARRIEVAVPFSCRPGSQSRPPNFPFGLSQDELPAFRLAPDNLLLPMCALSPLPTSRRKGVYSFYFHPQEYLSPSSAGTPLDLRSEPLRIATLK